MNAAIQCFAATTKLPCFIDHKRSGNSREMGEVSDTFFELTEMMTSGDPLIDDAVKPIAFRVGSSLPLAVLGFSLVLSAAT